MAEIPKRIIIARHGETVVEGTPQVAGGRTDVLLSYTGLAQADFLDSALRKEPVGLVAASPLRRAYRTALPTAKRRGLQVVRAPLVVERDFGLIERENDPDRQRAYRSELINFWHLPPEERLDQQVVPDMETDRSMIGRFKKFIAGFDLTDPTQIGVVVSHWDWISTFLLTELGELYSPQNVGRVELLVREGTIEIVDMHDINLVTV